MTNVQTGVTNNVAINSFVVIDTSAILYDADCIFAFPGSTVVIPFVVLDEVDKFRSLDDDVGRNARRFIRTIDSLRGDGDLSSGVPLGTTPESTLRIHIPRIQPAQLSHVLDLTKNDDRILSVSIELKLTECGIGQDVVLVTKDVALLVKACVLGVSSRHYSEDRIVKDTSELYTGAVQISVPPEVVDMLYKNGSIPIADVCTIFESRGQKLGCQFYPNMCVTLVDETSASKSGLSIVRDSLLIKIKSPSRLLPNVEPKNREQQFASALMLDDSVKLVTLTGGAGVGKTLMAIACGIHMTMDNKKYDRLVVSRPIYPLGKELGFLPGDADEKMDPWMAPIRDAIEFVFGGDRHKYDELKSFGYIEIEPLTYIRGRSMPRTLFILDEAQNITKHEVKTIISRIGKDSKIILTGDVSQIDNPYLDTMTNGLTYVVEKFKNYPIAGHVTFVKGQRSELATLAAEIL